MSPPVAVTVSSIDSLCERRREGRDDQVARAHGRRLSRPMLAF